MTAGTFGIVEELFKLIGSIKYPLFFDFVFKTRKSAFKNRININNLVSPCIFERRRKDILDVRNRFL